MLRSRARILGLVLLSVSIGYGSFAGFQTRVLADERVLSAPSKDPGLILRVATWGGPYEAAQREVLFDPFAAVSGISVATVAYTGGLDILQPGDVPDLVDMLKAEARRACQEGLLQSLDIDAVLPDDLRATGKRAPSWQDGLRKFLGSYTPVDFVTGSLDDCSIAHLSYSTVFAYDARAYPGIKPQAIEDFFDTTRFPGKRAVHRSADDILEWALMAEGVPLSQIYDLLSTERGLRLAFRRLDALRPSILWWSTPDEPVRWLADGDVRMAQGYNGRFFDLRQQGVPVDIVWDGQILDLSVWAIPTEAEHAAVARQFIRFALGAEQLAKLAERIPYGPSRTSAFKRVGVHPSLGIPMRDQLPTAPHHLDRALIRDTSWYASTDALRARQFARWLEE